MVAILKEPDFGTGGYGLSMYVKKCFITNNAGFGGNHVLCYRTIGAFKKYIFPLAPGSCPHLYLPSNVYSLRNYHLKVNENSLWQSSGASSPAQRGNTVV